MALLENAYLPFQYFPFRLGQFAGLDDFHGPHLSCLFMLTAVNVRKVTLTYSFQLDVVSQDRTFFKVSKNV